MKEEFGVFLRRKRLERGILTVREAATSMGVRGMLQQYESGKFLPDPGSARGMANLQKICQFYELSLVDCIAQVNEERIERKREKPRFLEELRYEERVLVLFFRGPGKKELFSSIVQKMDDEEEELILLFRRLTDQEKSNLFFILRKFVR